MIIISDTSPITALLSIDLIAILEKIYKKVIIPNAVYSELLKEHISLPDFIEIQQVQNNKLVDLLLYEVDIGEAESIVLAKEIQADLLLIDERIGRNVAEREGIKIIGLVGVLLIAKRMGYIDSLRKVVSLLEEKAGFWLSDALKEYIFMKAGE